MKVGRTSMSPLRFMMTRWPGRLYRKHILQRRATASCAGTSSASAKALEGLLSGMGNDLPSELTDGLEEPKMPTSSHFVGIDPVRSECTL